MAGGEQMGKSILEIHKRKFPTYEERRTFLNAEFDNLLEYVRNREIFQAADSVFASLENVSADAALEAWERASKRRLDDPEGAITAAKSMLESTCKFILDELKLPYDAADDLPKLYKAVATALNLSPGGHSEQIFKQILGGCTSVVQGLGAVRNTYGDAHGKGQVHYRPLSRHADLAVNLAGSLSAFLINTFLDRDT